MKYFSSRGGMEPQDFSEILLEGLAPDGGLYVPETIPQLSAQQIGEMAQAAGLEDVTDEDIETAYYLAADQLNDVLGAQGAFDAELAAEDEDEFLAQIGQEPVQRVQSRMQGARDQMMQAMMGKR